MQFSNKSRGMPQVRSRSVLAKRANGLRRKADSFRWDDANKAGLMALDIKHPPEDWQRVTGVRIIDPDGWTTNMLDWGAPLTRDDFLSRAACSTAEYPPGFFDQFR